MPITIEVNKNQLNGDLKMHFLPAKIDGDGPANVADYFENYITKDNDTGCLQNALRGYPINGIEINVPPKYKAIVLQETQTSLNENADRKLRTTGDFNKFVYWNYDKIPSNGDAYNQTQQFLSLAEQVAEPVTKEEFEEEFSSINAAHKNSL